MYLLIYIDEMLIATKEISKISKIKAQLKGEFVMKDFGVAKKILGIEICNDREAGKLYLSQKNTLREYLSILGCKKTKLVSTPLANHFRLSTELSPQTEQKREYMSHVPYASVVGSLMYGIICTCSDISYAINVVNRYMGDSGNAHWQTMKWILRYLRGTTDVGLMFNKIGGLDGCIVGFVDSNYVGDHDKRRSLIGYVFILSS